MSEENQPQNTSFSHVIDGLGNGVLASEAIEYMPTVELRLATTQDVPLILEWRRHPQVNAWMPYEDEEALQKYYDMKYINNRDNVYSDFLFIIQIPIVEGNEIFLKPVGTIALSNIYFRLGLADISDVMIGEVTYRNYKLAQSAILVLINYAFKELKFRKLLLRVSDNNHVAIRIYQKIGFKKITTNRDNSISMEIINFLI